MNILIADGQELYREGLRWFIHQQHPEAQITEATTGREVLNLLETKDITLPDLLLMELNLPGVDGVDATARLRNQLPNLKIIINTEYGDDWLVDQLVGLGVCGYLLKCDPKEQLELAIQTIRKGGTYFSGNISGALQREIIRNKRFQRNFHRFRRLSDRELEVLKLICQEYTNRDIAEELSLSVRTVDNHRNKLLEKCEVKNTAGLVMYAIRNGLVDVVSTQV
ncbi:MAG: response regulator transcription factor [Tunicatimonas sp.]